MKKVLFLITIILISFVSSKIIFEEQPHDIYNKGDLMNFGFYIQSDTEYSGYVESMLECGSGNSLVFWQLKHFNKDEKQNFDIDAIASEKGDCKIKINFNSYTEFSKEFEISDEIIINFTLNNKYLLPLEKLIISGNASKENGKEINSVVEIKIGDFLKQNVDIKNGLFSFEYVVPKEISPGKYSVQGKIEEKNNGELLNQGSFSEEIEILSKPSNIKIESLESFVPPKNLNYSVYLLDQSGKILENESVLIKIFDTENNIVSQKTVLSNSKNIQEFFDDSKRGGWKISAYYGSIYSYKQIYVLENKKIKITTIDSQNPILIQNIGNVPYDGVFEISLNNGTDEIKIPLSINLSVGESISPNIEVYGIYNISLEGEEFSNINFPSITANAIGDGMNFKLRNLFIPLAFVILVLGGYFFIRKNVRRKKSKPIVPVQKLYTMIFNSPDNEEIRKLSLRRDFNLRSMGNNNYCVIFRNIKDEKPEKRLLMIAKNIISEFRNINILIDAGNNLNDLLVFNSSDKIKELFSRARGVLISERVYNPIYERMNLRISEVGSLAIKEKNIKIYRLE